MRVGPSPEVTLEVIERYDRPVPRYTSYPPVPYWSETYGPADHARRLEASREDGGDLSVYIHIPFCVRRCLFCGCNVRVTRDEALPRRYLQALAREAEAVVSHVGRGRSVSQFHIGGGTPTHLTPGQLRELVGMVGARFDVRSDAERSLEVHPTVTTTAHMDALADLGFNRISMGVQDFDPEVQRRINRHQTYEETASLVEAARDRGFLSVNLDLVYGLPYQTEAGVADTMEKVRAIRPNRVAVYSYAHMPQQFPHQRGFGPAVVPSGRDKMRLFLLTRSALIEAGYVAVGFDHFCLPTDELWRAAREGTLQRNFMGYTTQAGKDLVGLGVSAISDVQGGYAQNAKDLEGYFALAESIGLATHRGMQLTPDDLVRRDAIMGLLCNGRLRFAQLRDRHGPAAEAIIEEAERAAPHLIQEGLVAEDGGAGWSVTELGWIFGRIVASAFDARSRTSHVPTFSRGV